MHRRAVLATAVFVSLLAAGVVGGLDGVLDVDIGRGGRGDDGAPGRQKRNEHGRRQDRPTVHYSPDTGSMAICMSVPSTDRKSVV